MWIYRLNYIFDHCLIKTSILLFYNYVASSHKAFHLIVRTLIVIIVATSFGMAMASIFICRPVSDSWSFSVFMDGFKGIYASQCYDPTILWLFNAGFNLATDSIIWILPIPFVLNLRSMPVKRRLELVAIFSIGILAIVASAVRLYVITQWLSNWNNQGANTSNLLIWSQVEQHAGIISGSIPFLRPLVRKAMRGAKARERHPSPSPAAKLIQPQITPDNPMHQRTPIIPSPVPTVGSDREFRAPLSPLSPISPMRPEIYAVTTV